MTASNEWRLWRGLWSSPRRVLRARYRPNCGVRGRRLLMTVSLQTGPRWPFGVVRFAPKKDDLSGLLEVSSSIGRRDAAISSKYACRATPVLPRDFGDLGTFQLTY
jgi:hypothetical protein